MIISSIDSPLYALAPFLHNIIKDNVLKPHSHINNSFKLKLDGCSLNNKYSLISLDAISLFTNIPLDLAVKNVSDRWPFISCKE